jgi:hypothetical protein
MKQGRMFIGVCLLAVLLSPAYAGAQSSDPPPCCNGKGEATGSVNPESHGSPSMDTQITISENVLTAMGLTRSEFIDRLAAGLFPDREVSLVLSTTSNVDPDSFVSLRAPGSERSTRRNWLSAGEPLLAVQVKRYYMVTRSRVTPADLEDQDQFYMTDGDVYVEIFFKRSPSQLAAR